MRARSLTCPELLLATAFVALGCGGGSPGGEGAAGSSASAGASSSAGGVSSSAGANAAGAVNVAGGANATAGAGAVSAGGSGGASAGGAPNAAGATGLGGSGTAGTGTAGAGTAGAGGRGPCQPPPSYRNLFTEILSKSAAEVDARVNEAYAQLFHGSASDQPIYYELGADQAYLLDVVHNDVRSEGVSYGMMIAVQLDKHAEFDKLWQFAVKRMRQSSGFFAWQLNPQGGVISSGSAPDGEEYFATALMFASKRWGDGSGDLAYSTQAKTLLDKMANNGMFDKSSKLVLFGVNAGYTDASYILPSFYEAWACFDSKNQQFWKSAASAGRAFFPKTVHSTTGLAPEQSELNGAPYSGHADFDADAWRVVMNVMMDRHFFNVDPWQDAFASKLGAFFKSKGSYGEQYTLDGMVEDPDHQSGLVALNATLGFSLPKADATPFVQELWDLAIPSGNLRYYNGSLYLLALLHVSGKFQLWY